MGPNGEEVDTACIVTTAANGVSAAIHPRLPALIEAADLALWLEPDEQAAAAAAALLRPAANDKLVFAPVGEAVNKADNDRPDIMEPIGPWLRGSADTRRGEPGDGGVGEQLDLL